VGAVNVLSLFSGYGGLDLALKMVIPEARPVLFVEIEKYPQQVLRKRWPDVPILEDVYELQGHEFAKRIPGGVQWVTGGFPCQAFSHAGKRGGKGDARGVLFWEITRVASEIREAQGYLPALFLENVAGLLSMRNDDHIAVFGEMLLALHEVGYGDIRWGVVGATHAGAPHKRERVFILANS
jgi:DNA (cytosine-5)-methyltransferase 1